jgi:hypothetical protein
VIAYCTSVTLQNEPRRTLWEVILQTGAYEMAPTGTGRHNVRDDARMPCEPGFYAGTRVRALVVRHQVQGDTPGPSGVEISKTPDGGAARSLDQ